MMGAVGAICLMLLCAVAAANDAAMNCDPEYACAMNPCMYTKCSAGHQCLNCNCTSHCVKVTDDLIQLGVLQG